LALKKKRWDSKEKGLGLKKEGLIRIGSKGRAAGKMRA
jgi:hypothetical protein